MDILRLGTSRVGSGSLRCRRASRSRAKSSALSQMRRSTIPRIGPKSGALIRWWQLPRRVLPSPRPVHAMGAGPVMPATMAAEGLDGSAPLERVAAAEVPARKPFRQGRGTGGLAVSAQSAAARYRLGKYGAFARSPRAASRCDVASCVGADHEQVADKPGEAKAGSEPHRTPAARRSQSREDGVQDTSANGCSKTRRLQPVATRAIVYVAGYPWARRWAYQVARG